MALRNHRHHHGGGFHSDFSPFPLRNHPPDHRLHQDLTFFEQRDLCSPTALQQKHRRAHRLGIGTPIDDDADAPSTPTTAQPSSDGWKSDRVPRVLSFWWKCCLGETSGEQPRIKQNTLEEDWEPSWRERQSSIALLDNIRNIFISWGIHLPFPRVENNTIVRPFSLSYIVCKGVMILRDHAVVGTCRRTIQ